MRISVVVPSYNAERTIAGTLDALLAQRVPAAEIVVVDDGSTDATRTVLEPYADRVRVVLQENAGVSAARNRGVAETTGDWVAFCDADDVWHPDKTGVVLAVLRTGLNVDLVFHDFWTIVEDRVTAARATHSDQTMFPIFQELDITIPRMLTDRTVVETSVREFPEVDTWRGVPFRWLMLGNFLMPSAVIIRRTAFDEAGGFDAMFRYAEDTEFFLRFSKGRSFIWIDAPLTGYRRAAGSLLTGNMLPTMRNAARAVEKHCVEDTSVYRGADADWVRSAVARRFTRLAYFCLSELNAREARAHARTAIGHRPTDLRAWRVWAGSYVPSAVLRAARSAREASKRPSEP